MLTEIRPQFDWFELVLRFLLFFIYTVEYGKHAQLPREPVLHRLGFMICTSMVISLPWEKCADQNLGHAYQMLSLAKRPPQLVTEVGRAIFSAPPAVLDV